MKVFFDSSGYAKRFIQEPGSQRVDAICKEATALGLSILCVPEIISALCRRRRESRLTKLQYKEVKQTLFQEARDVFLINITSDVIRKAIDILEKHPLKTLDGLHISCALVWEAELFASADKKQVAAARHLGLKTELL